MKKTLLMFIVAALALFAAGCTNNDTARIQDEKASEQILVDMQKAHPVPKFQRSQLRQNLIEIITAQAETTQTTSFFWNMGMDTPIGSCPSIGFPIPSTMQLTNPDDVVGGDTDVVVKQIEPTGVYTGDSTGTYVMCVDAQGRAYAVYWEGFVQVVAGPAEFKDGQVSLIGPPSFDFSGGK